MILGLTPSGAVKTKSDSTLGLRAVSCACCESPCPEITSGYTVISEAMYNALRAGGTISASGGGSEWTGCSFSATATGTLGGDNCGGSAGVEGNVCVSAMGNGLQSYMTFTWGIAKVGLEYRLGYGGGGVLGVSSGACFTDFYHIPNACYTVGFFTSWEADTNGGQGFLTNVGTTTLTTSAGSLTFGIWNLDATATASLDITITPSP